jgi:hypothetical protein
VVADGNPETAADAANPSAGTPAAVADSSTAGPADATSEADADLPTVTHHGES